MKEHTRLCVSLLTLFVTLVIFVQTNVLTIMIFSLKREEKQVVQVEKEVKTGMIQETKEWQLSIPKIKVSGRIVEGTDEKTINTQIGHFENTPCLEGNIGLVAGCDGYEENYFADLEKLEEGDVILYQYGEQYKQYQVTRKQDY
ncbi:MAG: sortase [Clostridia bacterium]|nr:sortase [Clostridia bacterium]